MKTVVEWNKHWDAKAEIEDMVALNGYCVGGVPISRETYFAAVVNPAIDLLDLQPCHRVLDIGCGAGLTLGEIEMRVAEAVGTDLSRAMIERYQGKARTYVCAAHELPFEGETFDRILMFSVAIYFPSFDYFRLVVEKALSMLRPNGLFLIGDLNLGRNLEGSQFQWYGREQLLDYLDSLDLPYSLMSQSKLKRTINRRWDVLIRKD